MTDMQTLRPYGSRGRFIPLACQNPACGYGTLRYQGEGEWRCDGLADPGRTDRPLEPCEYTHFDGEPARRWWRKIN